MKSRRHKFHVGLQEGFIHVGEYEDGTPGEVFIKLSKQGSTLAGFADTTAILVSRLLQHGDKIDEMAKHFRGMSFEPSGLTSNENKELKTATSIVDYLFRWLEFEYGEGRPAEALPAGTMIETGCPECEGVVYYAEGCQRCDSCDWSKCG